MALESDCSQFVAVAVALTQYLYRLAADSDCSHSAAASRYLCRVGVGRDCVVVVVAAAASVVAAVAVGL